MPDPAAIIVECRDARARAVEAWHRDPHTAQRIANTMYEAGEAIAYLMLREQRIAALERELGEAKELLQWFHDRRFALQSLHDLWGAEDTAAALKQTLAHIGRALSPSPVAEASEEKRG